ncbi:heparinase II/III family protein [bacterium]|nr:heparinase II/III family protein [bacterium]
MRTSWLHRISETTAVGFSLEYAVNKALEKEESCNLKGKLLFGQFSGVAGVDEAKTYAMREQLASASETLLDYFSGRMKPLFFLHNSDIKLLHEKLNKYPEVSQLLQVPGQMAMSRRFRPYGSKNVYELPLNINWNSDFRGGSYPILPVKKLKELLNPESAELLKASNLYGHPPLKYTEELNEHMHFLDLVRIFWITGQDNYASEFLSQAAHWAATNPIWQGVNWLNFDNIAIRLTNWIISLNMCLGCRFLLAHVFTEILASAILQAAALAWHLQHDPEPSLAAASALCLFSNCFPELKLSSPWLKLALDRFPDAIEREFSAGGLHLSNSSSAHCRAAEWLLLPMVFYYRAQISPPMFLEQSCGNVLNALNSLVGPGRWLSDIGTHCRHGLLGRHVSLSDYAKNLLCLGAAALNHGKWTANYENMPGELFWWLGLNAENDFNSLNRDYPTTLDNYFAANGVGITRDGWRPNSSQCTVIGNTSASRNVSPGFPNLPTAQPENHCDNLSVVLDVQGEPFLIEPGASSFRDAFGTYLSSFFAHSAPCFSEEITPFKVGFYEDLDDKTAAEIRTNGLESVKIGDLSLCSPLYTKTSDRGLIFIAKRQARLKNGFTAVITRELLFDAFSSMLFIRDSFTGPKEAGDLHLQSSLLLAPHLKLIMRGDMGCQVRGQKVRARVIPIFPKGTRNFKGRGISEHAPTGWYNGREPLPTSQIRYYSVIKLPQKAYYIIDWTGKDPPKWHSSKIDELLDF